MSTSDVETYLNAIEHPVRRSDSLRLDQIMREVSGYNPHLISGKMVGYGQYHYTYDTGHSGTAMATGFAPQKTKLSIYIMPGYADLGPMLERLGKHKLGKACLYINKLADVDEEVLKEIIAFGLKDLATRWDIEAT